MPHKCGREDNVYGRPAVAACYIEIAKLACRFLVTQLRTIVFVLSVDKFVTNSLVESSEARVVVGREYSILIFWTLYTVSESNRLHFQCHCFREPRCIIQVENIQIG